MLSLGATDRRLVGEGDFNVEAGYHELFRGLNTIVISIVDHFGNVTSQSVDVNVDQSQVWPLPYQIDWSRNRRWRTSPRSSTASGPSTGTR
ncbi:MAG: hypothetical protein R2705_10740 [Ilumatobacteraceae bacterium]